MAKLTKTLSPAGTLTPAASVTASVVPSVFDEAVPTFLTNATAAFASDPAGPTTSTRARSTRAASSVVFPLSTPAILPPPSGPTAGSGTDMNHPAHLGPFAWDYRHGMEHALVRA